jgi:hypothetical protein
LARYFGQGADEGNPFGAETLRVSLERGFEVSADLVEAARRFRSPISAFQMTFAGIGMKRARVDRWYGEDNKKADAKLLDQGKCEKARSPETLWSRSKHRP